jgi:hypothetical protein
MPIEILFWSSFLGLSSFLAHLNMESIIVKSLSNFNAPPIAMENLPGLSQPQKWPSVLFRLRSWW